MLHPPTALGTLPAEYCLGPIDPTTLPKQNVDDMLLSEEEIARQEARDAMPAAQDMLLVQDFETWAEKVLSSVAWAYYRSASDHEACKSHSHFSDLRPNSNASLKHSMRTGMLTKGTSSGHEFYETCHTVTPRQLSLISQYRCL